MPKPVRLKVYQDFRDKKAQHELKRLAAYIRQDDFEDMDGWAFVAFKRWPRRQVEVYSSFACNKMEDLALMPDLAHKKLLADVVERIRDGEEEIQD